MQYLNGMFGFYLLKISLDQTLPSVCFYTLDCWGSSIWASKMSRTNKLIRKAGSVIAWKQDTVEAVMRWMLKNCYPSWLMLITLSTTHGKDCKAPFPWDCSSSAVEGSIEALVPATRHPNVQHATSVWPRKSSFKYIHYSIIQHPNYSFIYYLSFFSQNNNITLLVVCIS